ncbi:type II toxin-antitoxin system HicA family toxin [Leptolyngbya sp. FACHB-36]|uniref:type II toxin-antitoxin system HicA family toxin n=1 Tax=Leptolyngbya sp. FACHB-36 TaxID=2692808 RepID=UPI001681A8D2|nr:type II toxin-antitoxin system HicA family toxin [Leptolyngbya sp. FACHB-36]MBD2019495.1 type II toxin-antitoxin system HicA family toxin [Leptolyngbya sp. FACHB-36]
MPAKAKELERVARKLGFEKARQKGSHARWKHSDGRATTIPIHGNAEIGGWLFQEILSQLGITEEEFNQLR